MFITCLDLEGVLVPEIWIAFAEASGIPELKRTTRDEPDYNKLKPVLFQFPSYEYLATGEVLGKCLSFKSKKSS